MTKLNIKDIEFEDLKKMEDVSGYDFSVIKIKAILEKTKINDETGLKNTKPEISENETFTRKDTETEIYIKMIKKDKIKESIFCYWSLLYDEKFKNYEESEFTSVINKVRITETESEENKHSVLLDIKENKWGVLEYGSTIHLVKFEKYLNENTMKKAKSINEWKKYIEEGSQDVLFIGVVN